LNIEYIKDAALACVEKARQYVFSDSISDVPVGLNPSGDVSKTFDVEVEKILINCLVDRLKDVVIVSEESGTRVYGSARFVVLMDPVDGSVNFESDIPWSATSIAIGLNRYGGATLRDVVFALVSELQRNRTYVYSSGNVDILGTKNKRRYTPKKVVLGYFNSVQSLRAIELYMGSYTGERVLRVLGSAALDIINVALGNAEVFIDIRNKIRNLDVGAALKIALALGSKAYIAGFDNPLDLPIDRILKIGCVVGFNDVYLSKALEALRRIGYTS